MRRRRVAFVALALVALAVVVGGVAGPGGPTGAQDSPTSDRTPADAAAPDGDAPAGPTQDPADQPPAVGPLRLAEVSSWVEAEGTWVARFDVVGAAPLDAEVRVSIRQRLTGDVAEVRAEMAALRAGDDPPDALQNEISSPIGALLSPGTATIRVPIRDRAGDPDRVLVPNPGVHPVLVTLRTADGQVLQEERLFLNRLPREVPGGSDETPLQLALPLDISSPATVRADSTWTLPAEGVAEARRAVDLLESEPSVPVSLRPDPDLLAAMAADPTETTVDLLDRLGRQARRNESLRQTWVELDLEAWASRGRPADFDQSLVAGQATLADQLGTEPNTRVWGEDPTLGPQALERLTGVGVDQLVLTAGQVGPESSPSEDVPTMGTIEVLTDDRPLDAIVVDPALQFLLIDPAAVPAEAAHQVVSELQAIWFASPTDAVPGTVLPLDDRTPRATAAALLAALAGGPVASLEVTDLAGLFERTGPAAALGGDESSAARPLLFTPPGEDVAPLSAFLAELRPRDRAHRVTTGEVEDLVPISEVLLASQDRTLGAGEQRARLDGAARRIDEDFAALRAPPTRNLTVTSRRASLPLQLANDLDRPATVELRFSGTRLQIDGGRRRTIELEPGINRVDIPVTARTSGQFVVGIELRTADGTYLLDSSSLRIRSTVFGGVGLLLGGGALAFLALWWLRSWRRSRRSPDEAPTSVA